MSNAAHPRTGHPWSDWPSTPIANDASARSYTRCVGPNKQSVIMMDSGPVPTEDFCTIAKLLSDAGFCAPKILYNASPILVLEDLGEIDVAQALASGGKPETIYQVAVDVLVQLRGIKSVDLSRLTPDVAGEMVKITGTHYAPDANPDLLAKQVTRHMARLASAPTTLALRDYHVENLIWRPEREGTDRIGLLDFQDAFLAPDGYDLASLLRDVRRDVPPQLSTKMTAYFCKRTGQDPDRLRPQLAVLAAQRNLRILGVFARLIREEGKDKYLRFMPRVWSYLMMDLEHPMLSELKATVLDQLPAPHQAGFG